MTANGDRSSTATCRRLVQHLAQQPHGKRSGHVLDRLFDQDKVLDIQEHFTDTGGASDHVFRLFASIGAPISAFVFYQCRCQRFGQRK
jgi:Tn3 transposase DDE domain